MTRREPDLRSDERTALSQWVDFHRETLLQKCQGLSPHELTLRSVPPSSLSLLGLVRHMTDVERWWFLLHIGGKGPEFVYWDDEGGDPEFDHVDPDHAERDLATYRETVALCRTVAAQRSLEDVVPRHGDPEIQYSVRWIWLHMIEEYARHNGHADLLRESIDGSIGD